MEYVFGNVGEYNCPNGNTITDYSTCLKACDQLGLPHKVLENGHICYKDKNEHCYQDGYNQGGAALICKKVRSVKNQKHLSKV